MNSMVRKITVNAVIDTCALVAFVPSLVSGLVLLLVLPCGSGYQGGRNPLVLNEYLGIARADWLFSHNLSSLILALLIILHILLHLRFFRNVPRYLGRAQDTGECEEGSA
jgi:hypothetical protein